MIKEALIMIIEGYEPFDLLCISRDAFYDVVAQYFPKIIILEMELSFIVLDDKSAISVKITDYKEEK